MNNLKYLVENTTSNQSVNNNVYNENKNTQTSAAVVITGAWAENLKRNQEQRLKDRKWFNMQPGEKTVLEFQPEFGPVCKNKKK